MKKEDIEKDLKILVEYNEKRQELNRQLFIANGHKSVSINQLQTELNKLPWSLEYEEVFKKYIKLFRENKIEMEDYESSPLEDFLKAYIVIDGEVV